MMTDLVRKGWTVLALWALTMILGYFGLGGFLAETVEGIGGVPAWPTALFVVLLAVSLWASVVWARGLKAKPEAGAALEERPLASGRRRFLTGTAAVTGGMLGAAGATIGRVAPWATVTLPALRQPVTVTDPNPKDDWLGARVRSYRPLGDTGLMVSDIATGSTRIHHNSDPVGYLKSLLDRGVNYIDASPDYAPESEGIIAEAIVGRPRDQLVIASKFCTRDGHLRQGSSVAAYMTAIDGTLSRMGTDYIDVAHIHSCDSTERLMDENVHEAFDRLKDAGKVRHLGVSTHTPNLEEVADTAIDSGRFKVMMLAYHHGAWPKQMDIIDRAAAAGMGIVAMKTLKGAKHRGLAEFRPEADSYAQAAFKWVLANPSVSNLVVSFYDNQHPDEYLFASGKSLERSDIAVLGKYDQLIAGTHCFQHCGDCLGACPSGLAINDILRHRMYFEDYGDEKQAMQLYAKLDRQADVCIDCSAPCLGSCPQGVEIQERMIGAHEKLRWA
jgi:predicted aldo/keto reductase-like oxidoreductase